MFAPALCTEGRSEIVECLSLLQCVSSRVLDCYCFWYFGAYHSFCLVDVYLSPLHSSVLCQSPKRFCIPVSGCSANARSSAYSMMEYLSQVATTCLCASVSNCQTPLHY